MYEPEKIVGTQQKNMGGGKSVTQSPKSSRAPLWCLRASVTSSTRRTRSGLSSGSGRGRLWRMRNTA
eukprot:6257405-Prymnesium_polylepis.1